jgi:hypothetical protein
MNIFVGREQEVDEAVKQLMDLRDEAAMWHVVGVHGIGKSKFMQRVRAEAEVAKDAPSALDFDLSAEQWNSGFHGDVGAGASPLALWASFQRSRDFMIESANRLQPSEVADAAFDEFGSLRQGIEKKADKVIYEYSLPADGAGGRPISVVEHDARRSIRTFQAQLDDLFLDAWSAFARHRRVLVTLDDFEKVAEDEFGSWLLRLALTLPHTLTLVAWVPQTAITPVNHPRVRRLDLPYFTVDEVATYLTRRLHEQPLHPRAAHVVHHHTDGHPGGVELAGSLLVETGIGNDHAELVRFFDRLPDDPKERWGSLVHGVLEAVADPMLRQAVDAASITVSFDAALLAALLEIDDAAKLVETLSKYKLTQRVDRPGYIRLLEFIRISLADKLTKDEAPKLHGRAALYFFGLLQEEEGEKDASGGFYAGWHRYESPVWQANMRAWLYYSGFVNRPELTRSRFVLVFLEAFWWWGCYHRFDFNQWLIEDWEQALRSWKLRSTSGALDDDQTLADALRFLLDNYPVGHEKPATAKWDEIHSRLRLAQDLCGLTDGTPLPPNLGREEKRQMTQARAMIKVFLAHTRRFRDPTDPAAARYYADAMRFFEKRDQWVLAWLLFETADMALERNQPDEAMPLLARSAAAAVDLLRAQPDSEAADESDDDGLDAEEDTTSGQCDFELFANLHRAWADAHWFRGQTDAAAAAYGRAVRNAYWFQGMPTPADPYTRQFYQEMTGRAVERVLTLARRDPERAVPFVAGMRAELGSAAPVGDIDAVVHGEQKAELRAVLFPREPDPITELEKKDSPFMDQWRRHWDDRGDPAQSLAAIIGAEPERASAISAPAPAPGV